MSFFSPIIRESLEMDYQYFRKLPKIKFLRCLNKVLACGAVPAGERDRGVCVCVFGEGGALSMITCEMKVCSDLPSIILAEGLLLCEELKAVSKVYVLLLITSTFMTTLVLLYFLHHFNNSPNCKYSHSTVMYL